jgi:hypothetical protein
MKVLVCGTRGRFKDYNESVLGALSGSGATEIIEGCCKNSADEYAEAWGKKYGIKVNHYPSNEGNYIKRNIEMVDACDKVIAFWDGFSYGTAHTIGQAVMKKKDVLIIPLEREPAKNSSLKMFIGVEL